MHFVLSCERSRVCLAVRVHLNFQTTSVWCNGQHNGLQNRRSGSSPGAGANFRPRSPIGRGAGLRCRRVLVRIRPGAPVSVRSCSSVVEQPPVERQVAGSKPVRTARSSLPAYANKVERRALNPRGFRFDSGCGYARVAQLAGGASFKPRTVRVRLPPRVPFLFARCRPPTHRAGAGSRLLLSPAP
jgi:hypothetical protein